jgi:hypothetical protein
MPRRNPNEQESTKETEKSTKIRSKANLTSGAPVAVFSVISVASCSTNKFTLPVS